MPLRRRRAARLPNQVQPMSETLVEIETSRLQPGMYVQLDLAWMDHPFPWSRFKLRSEADVRALRDLGLKTVRYCRKRSDTEPLAAAAVPGGDAPAAANPQARADMAAIMAEKHRRGEYLASYRATIAESRRILAASGKAVRGLHGDLFSRPRASIEAAAGLVDDLVARLPDPADTVLYSINDKAPGAAIYNHSVNVSILGMLLANKLALPAEAMRLTGIGSLFHDVGLVEIPARIRNKTEGLTAAERALMEDHCIIGERMVRAAGLAPAAIDIVMQHHELVDGRGYPKRLTAAQISPLARLVAIIELYEQFCNSPDPSRSLTPHEAVSQLFLRYRNRLDAEMLEAFIHMMGVYPPGSIVALSNGCFGKVLAVSPKRPLQPVLLVFDAEIPREEAVPLSLEATPEISIVRALRPSLLPRDAFAYLAPPRRAVYFFGPAGEQP